MTTETAKRLKKGAIVRLTAAMSGNSATGTVMRPLSKVEKEHLFDTDPFAPGAPMLRAWWWVRTEYGQSWFRADGLEPL